MGRKSGPRARRSAVAGLIATALGLAAWPAAAQTSPNLTGFWQLTADSQRPLPAPALTAWGREQAAEVAKLTRDIERWCLVAGMPATMRGSRPISLLQGRTEVAVLPEVIGSARHIYTAVKTHPDPDSYDFTQAGHSIGRWEGQVLVVDTNGFKAGVGPAGAPRTEEATLVERFRLAGPDRLVVESTWTDPKVFARAYTYTQTFARVPEGYNAGESFCDPRDRVPPGTE